MAKFFVQLVLDCPSREEADRNVEQLLSYYEGYGEFDLVSIEEENQ